MIIYYANGKYTNDLEVAQAYQEKGFNVKTLRPFKLKREDVITPAPSKGAVVFVIVTRTKWEALKDGAAWSNSNFDSRDFDTHRISLDSSMALFQNRVKTQVNVDTLNTWKSQGHIVDWYYYNPQEEDGETILTFLRGNVEWESQEV